MSGPPELPKLIAASVWMKLARPGTVVPMPTCRFLPETTPTVTVRSSENGFPIAITHCPILRESESPRGSVGSFLPFGVDLDEPEIDHGIGADDLGRRTSRRCRASPESSVAPSTDVVVGQDVPVARDDEPGAGETRRCGRNCRGSICG